MADQVQQIYLFLKSRYLHFSEKWVIEAIEYYRSRDPNISLQSLKNEIYDQWKLNNLRDFKIPSLPPNLSSQEKIMLPGKYAVQVEEMLDASQSCYSQLQKLHKVSLENIEATKNPTEWNLNIKPTRCLTFTLSDGVQEVKGMEYAPIKKLRADDPELLPGFKIVITGPVQCRKGMILLKDENIQVIGGEVEAFSEIYKPKSILCKRLNIEDSNDENEENSNPVENVNDNGLDTQDISNLLSENDDVFMNLSLDEDFEMSPQPNIQVNQLNDQSQLNRPREIINPEPSKKEKTKQTTLSSFLSQNVKKPERKKKDYPVKINNKPFVYLKEVIEINVRKPAVFTIKAVILTITKKIGIKDNNFAMTAIITDGSHALEAEFSPETVENIMGYSSDEILALSREKTRNSAVADRLKKIFTDAQRKLISLCCLMDVKFSNDVDPPCVISLEKMSLQHLNELKARKLQE